jgi:hypothetical protein
MISNEFSLKHRLFMIFFLFVGLAVAVRESIGTVKLRDLSSPILEKNVLKASAFFCPSPL